MGRTDRRTDQRTDRPTDRPTDTVTYRVACTRLKRDCNVDGNDIDTDGDIESEKVSEHYMSAGLWFFCFFVGMIFLSFVGSSDGSSVRSVDWSIVRSFALLHVLFLEFIDIVPSMNMICTSSFSITQLSVRFYFLLLSRLLMFVFVLAFFFHATMRGFLANMLTFRHVFPNVRVYFEDCDRN